jgi:uncharacterized protein (DUF2062 family)
MVTHMSADLANASRVISVKLSFVHIAELDLAVPVFGAATTGTKLLVASALASIFVSSEATAADESNTTLNNALTLVIIPAQSYARTIGAIKQALDGMP